MSDYTVKLATYDRFASADYRDPTRPYVLVGDDNSRTLKYAEELIDFFGIPVNPVDKAAYDASPYFVGKLLYSDVLVRQAFGLFIPTKLQNIDVTDAPAPAVVKKAGRSKSFLVKQGAKETLVKQFAAALPPRKRATDSFGEDKAK